MAYLFVDDGSHEADEYASNYIYFDETDPYSLQNALQQARGRNIQKNSLENLTQRTENFPVFSSPKSTRFLF